MKRLSNIFISLAAIFIAASCVVEEQVVTIEYNVSSGATKSNAEGDAINYIWYALYDLDGRFVADFKLAPVVGGHANCPVTMVKGRSYNVVFVAQHYSPLNGALTPTYPVNTSECRVYMPTSMQANSEAGDLFCGLDTVIEFSGKKPDNVVLQRVVAQVNILTEQTAWDAATAAGQLPDASQITLSGVPAAYGLISEQTVDSKVTVNYARSPLPGTSLQLGTAYCFADEEVSATIGLYKNNDEFKELTVNNVSVEPNKKTNIVWNTFI